MSPAALGPTVGTLQSMARISGGPVNQGAAQYDAVAQAYAQLVAPRYQPIAALLKDAVGQMVPRLTVIELAAGTGTLTRLLAPAVLAAAGEYVGVDISEQMLRQARGTLDPRVELVIADGEATGLAASSADLVVSSLGVLQDTDAGWREAARLLRPGGRLVLTMWGGDYAERDLIAEARRVLGGSPLPATPVDDALDRASRAGFHSLRHHDVRLPAVHDSMEDYLQYRGAFGNPPWVPPGRDADLIHALTTAAARYVNADGKVVLDWSVTVLEGTISHASRSSAGGPTPR